MRVNLEVAFLIMLWQLQSRRQNVQDLVLSSRQNVHERSLGVNTGVWKSGEHVESEVPFVYPVVSYDILEVILYILLPWTCPFERKEVIGTKNHVTKVISKVFINCEIEVKY